MAVPVQRMTGERVTPLAQKRRDASVASKEICRLCRCRMTVAELAEDDGRKLCAECRTRPEAASFGYLPPPGDDGSRRPRPFTTADKSLIKQVHGFMPAEQLLALLNERMVADLGDGVPPYTMTALHAEISQISGAVVAQGTDWSSLRKLMAQAGCSGILDKITLQTINDFAVVFGLSPAQVLRLKDVVLESGAGASGSKR